MKHYLLSLLFFTGINYCYAQKPTIDTGVFGKWSAPAAKISNDGKYIMTFHSNDNGANSTIIFLSSTNNWKLSFADGKYDQALLSANSKYGIFIRGRDSLGTLTLGNKVIKYIPGIASFRLSGNEINEYLIYSPTSDPKELIVRNLETGKKKIFKDVVSSYFRESGRYLVIEKNTNPLTGKELVVQDLFQDTQYSFNDMIAYCFNPDEKALWITVNSNDHKTQTLHLFDLQTKKTTTVWTGKHLDINFVLYKHRTQIAFFAGDGKEEERSVYYYRAGMKSAADIFSTQSPEFKDKYELADHWLNRPSFSLFGSKILIPLVLKEERQAKVTPSPAISPNLVLWSYKDAHLQSEQVNMNPSDVKASNTVWVCVDLANNNRLTKVSNLGEELTSNEIFEDFVLTEHRQYCDTCRIHAVYRYATTAYEHKKVVVTDKYNAAPKISPSGKFAVWYNPDSLGYYSYDIAKDKVRKISWVGEISDQFGIAGWGDMDNYVYIYDQYDIWKLDLNAKEKAINITNGYGKSHHLAFGLINFAALFVIKPQNKLLLSVFNQATKENGFATVDSKGKLSLGAIGPYDYCIVRTGTKSTYSPGERPVKAKNAEYYLVRRMSANNFPNYFVTTDFKSFKQVTDIQPQKHYNWLTNELVHWQMADGRMSQGILYKPEHFDPSKKYPLIFDYYEQRSDELHKFIEPDFSGDRLNIAYYVSNGYLVFVPDIYYTSGHDAEQIVNSVVSAAQYLSSFPFVDSAKLGLQGHSYGGYETNVLITRSRLFAAACAAAAPYDLVSEIAISIGGARYFQVGGNGSPYGNGVAPWTHPNLYVENSPIFQIGNITAPLLLMQGTKDYNVPPSQSIEQFTSMKVAGKKVWLLQYQDAIHGLGGDDAKDYTIRMKQFFDHYLKGAPPPKWMTVGVPYAERLKDSGLGLDTSGKQP